ncbi:MAG: efflux RND transporter periplasmic adaptor subunit, partial [Gammaproteobacteria bacterium]|nr:efflux RND transporter periplasmic adaptor subunit [Gammaproteobacteria bacterium]
NTGGEADIVSISPRVINMLGVRVSKVKKKTLYRRIDSVGNIKYNENKISHIHLRTDGWVERLSVKALGDRVKKGDLLFQIYSPKLVNAQEELLQSLDMGNDSLVDASRERLVSLGMSKSQVQTLKKSGKVKRLVSYYAPQRGVVSELNIREGMYVKPSKSIVSLVDMTTIWLIANVFESQSNWVKVGDRAEAELSFMPEKTWEGTVEHVYPALDQKTRSLEVRLRFDNPDEMLKANMYANVKIFAQPKLKALSIPRESLIQTGDGDRVIISLGDGKFKPVAVITGIESNNRIEILNGLSEGDSVVVSSQFLIDSESSLRASLLRMSGG